MKILESNELTWPVVQRMESTETGLNVRKEFSAWGPACECWLVSGDPGSGLEICAAKVTVRAGRSTDSVS